MCRTLFLVSALLAFLASLGVSKAQENNLALDQYTCAQFLSDATAAQDGNKVLKSLMMISWATGYAAAFQPNAPRADAAAIMLIAGVVSDACRKNPNLKAVQVVAEAITQFRASAPASSNQELLSPIKPVSVRNGAFITYGNFDLPAGDLHTLKSIELQACAAACLANHECRAYSYDKWNKWCFLKSKVTALTLDPSSLSGVRSDAEQPTQSSTPIRFDVRAGKSFEGSVRDLGTPVSVENCKEQCQKDEKCLGYTYLSKPRLCRFFTEITTIAAGRDAMSAFKTQSEQ